MFIVRRPFRNLGVTLTAGMVIEEPDKVKRFKGRLAEGKIVEVTKSNYKAHKAYFKVKYGVDLPPIEVNTAAHAEPASEVKQSVPAKVVASVISTK